MLLHLLTSVRWRWLGQLKQADGGFRMCIGGEEDVRWVRGDSTAGDSYLIDNEVLLGVHIAQWSSFACLMFRWICHPMRPPGVMA